MAVAAGAPRRLVRLAAAVILLLPALLGAERLARRTAAGQAPRAARRAAAFSESLRGASPRARSRAQRLLSMSTAVMLSKAAGARAETILEGRDVKFQAAAEELKRMDMDGDGYIAIGEFLQDARDFLDELGEENTEVRQSVLAIWSALFIDSDVSGDGYLNQAEVEFAQFLASLAGRHVRLIESSNFDDVAGAGDAEALFREADRNSDGRVDKVEYIEFMRDSDVGAIWGKAMEDESIADLLDSTYALADLDGNGSLGEQELFYFAYNLNEYIAVYGDDRVAASQAQR